MNRVVITPILIALNLIVFLATHDHPALYLKYGLNPYFMKAGFWWQPLTTMFLHASWSHLLMNMAVLFQFGILLERELGAHLRYLVIYFGGGILTSLLSYAFMAAMGMEANLIGASGAISVLFGWFAMKDPHLRGGLIVSILIISFAPLLMGIPIAWYAHLIGFGLGWIAGYLI